MPRFSSSLTGEEVADYLEAQRTGVLATIGRDGFPHQMAMWYIPEPGRILMWTYRRSQKAVNLRRDPRASFFIQDGKTYETLRGVLIRGAAELVEDTATVLELGLRLRRRYYPTADLSSSRQFVARQAPKRMIICLPITDVASWDHRKIPASDKS